MEKQVQSQYLLKFFKEKLGYRIVKANTVSPHSLIIEEDLEEFISQTPINQEAYQRLLRTKFNRDAPALLNAFISFLHERIRSSQNMALFLNNNKSVTFEGETIHLFCLSGSVLEQDKHFNTNIFSIVEELSHTIKYEGEKLMGIRPDFVIFVNGFYLSYGELKSISSGQKASTHGRDKIAMDYYEATKKYLHIKGNNDKSEKIRQEVLRIFEKGIHIVATDLWETYVMRNIASTLDEIEKGASEEVYKESFHKLCKKYPLQYDDESYQDQVQKFEEVAYALYSKKMIEQEIIYYNFLEREMEKNPKSKKKAYHHNDGKLISPRPKQKFGVDKIMERVLEFIEHENEPDYLLNKLKAQLKHLSEQQRNELIAKRMQYKNNKTVNSLLLQYAAGFGKSNIIGWAALQLKDLMKDGKYIFDKVMLVTDRIQLRDQLDSKLMNMNISNSAFVEAYNKETFLNALKGNTRVVIVNLQKFGSQISEILGNETTKALAKQRVAFLIDEIHRSNEGTQNEEMTNLFDELADSLSNDNEAKTQKKNLIIGLTATPSEQTLARYGEYNGYKDIAKIWIPFDAYTMQEAINDGFILNPLNGLVPVPATMYFEIPDPENASNYRFRKKSVYENPERREAIAKFIVERLITNTYPSIRGTGKAMLAVTSIPNAIAYKNLIEKEYPKFISKKKEYERFKDAPIYIVYSDSQSYASCSSHNNGASEEAVIQNFSLKKNGIIIVVDKLQTGFDEPKLHTLFLDKEIEGINAIQTISRVNRTTKNKADCKIIDFSYQNVNVQNIREAFAHFSNVVVTDFDPLNTEANLKTRYKELRDHVVFKESWVDFLKYVNKPDSQIDALLAVEANFRRYITNNADDARLLKAQYNKYFFWLNQIQYVLDYDLKLSEEAFLDFWRRFNNVYNSLVSGNSFDAVWVFFDNRIGITAPNDEEEETPQPERPNGDDANNNGTEYEYNIMSVIARKNLEEEQKAELIEEFARKIKLLFDYIPTHPDGKRLEAKIRAKNSNQEEIYASFEIIYKAFVRRNKAMLGTFFIKEMSDNVNKLCDDFERVL
jgi:type I restriction enzyme R subunit